MKLSEFFGANVYIKRVKIIVIDLGGFINCSKL